jgi:hypothetical protein
MIARANRDDNPLDVFADFANAVDILQGNRPAEDKGNDRRTLEPLLQHPMMTKGNTVVGSW